MQDRQRIQGAPRAVLIVAIALGALLAVGVGTIGVIAGNLQEERRQAAEAARQERRTGPITLPPVRAPEAGSAECAAVLAALPTKMRVHGDPVPRRPITAPAPESAVVWGDAEHDPITLRCGLAPPAELEPTSKLVEVSGVSWLPISQADKSTWWAVDRPVHVALTFSEGTGTGPVQQLSSILRETLPKQEVFP